VIRTEEVRQLFSHLKTAYDSEIAAAVKAAKERVFGTQGNKRLPKQQGNKQDRKSPVSAASPKGVKQRSRVS
jgi:hypothetical protein